MTVTSNRPARRGGPAPDPPDGALLHLALDRPDALAGVPAAPEEHGVSVSFSSRAAARTADPALVALGYRTVGVSAAGPGGAAPIARFLVPQGVIDRHPHWWDAMARLADQTFSLAAGPVQAAFADVLRTHCEPLR